MSVENMKYGQQIGASAATRTRKYNRHHGMHDDKTPTLK